MPGIYVVGSLNADFVVSVDRLPKAGETLTGGDLGLFAGGKGANQAVAVARLGAQVRMVGMVGSDRQGDFLIDSLQRAGADTGHIGLSERATGSAMIQVQADGDNSIVVSPGANAALEPAAVRDGLADIACGDLLLCQLEVPLEAVEEAVRVASERGAVSILDPAPARPLPAPLLRAVDVLTPNETESARMLEATSVDGAAALAALRANGSRNVVLKLGAEGAWVWDGASARHVPAHAVRAADTTAAGDVFNAGLAVRMAEGQPLHEAACFASAAAAISVTRKGAQASCPLRAEVDSFISGERSPRGSAESGCR